ncbi:hypothetical protein SBD_6065 [Streptomyces bottropensis ATCC 25435]|uniref:Uncharacterized protein n=1 Tax=Streptomyces bottropensis ATCC 25435 TaxID=1054862 RepID=M3FLN4_9ACTN|nr:hypothetical protein SBD_6065 [Streptomyces bottropensis ATCC 25435]
MLQGPSHDGDSSAKSAALSTRHGHRLMFRPLPGPPDDQATPALRGRTDTPSYRPQSTDQTLPDPELAPGAARVVQGSPTRRCSRQVSCFHPRQLTLERRTAGRQAGRAGARRLSGPGCR